MKILNDVKKITIEPFGGFGNNLQQIALAIMFAEKYKKYFILNHHPLVEDIQLNFGNKFTFLSKTKRSRFFYFGSDKSIDYMIDPPLLKSDSKYYANNFSRTFKTYIKPNIHFLNYISLPDNLLVIHIRNYEGHPDYAQNPISYYKYLYNKFEEILFVTDNPNSAIFGELKKFMKCEIQTSSLQNDFNTIYSAKNLATSGVGTFVIAAALLSDNLSNFYYSNLFLERALNPSMVPKNINKINIYFDQFLHYGKWGEVEKVKNFITSDIKFNIVREN